MTRSLVRKSWGRIAILVTAVAIVALPGYAAPGDRPGSDGAETVTMDVENGTIQPDSESEMTREAPTMSEAERAELRAKHFERRERLAAEANAPFEAEGAREMRKARARRDAKAAPFAPTGPEADAAGDGASEAATSFLQHADIVMPATGPGSETREPASIAVGRVGYQTTNWYTAGTRNIYGSAPQASNWENITIPSGPAATPFFCCDQDLEYDQGRNLMIWTLLYLNSSGSDGAVRMITWHPTDNAQPTGVCSYTFETSGSTVPDYPHVGIAADNIYINTNDITGSSWTGSRMIRIRTDDVDACTTAATATFTYNDTSVGQRVMVPVEGATDKMYWGMLEDTTHFRVFEWPDAAGAGVTAHTGLTISTSAHSNPTCAGGANGTDWIERSTAWSIAGFRLRGWVGTGPGGAESTNDDNVVGFVWNSSPTGGNPEAFIRSAVFAQDFFTLEAQPDMAYSDRCAGFPDVAVTDRGHPGLIFGLGGNANGTGHAVRPVGHLGDDVSSGGLHNSWGGGFYLDFWSGQIGTHNPNNRFGDYFTLNQSEPCGNTLQASTFNYRGGGSASDVTVHHTEFGRGRDGACWDKWHDEFG